eukprot:TRINITY_DN27166_c0_g1_i1.p1 TRINITY_DN27166_c0_g1~~TRINITY_DN27166_c0_g1_i1.p1  ORF type:complete len:259 (+),score=45.12 TRINITY_DN27166_c0_g1_i1:42-779(+)
MSALRSLQRSRDALQLLAALKLPAPWQRHDWCLFCCRGKPPSSAKVAGFDFDKTLHFGGPAWRLSSAHIPSRLKQLGREGTFHCFGKAAASAVAAAAKGSRSETVGQRPEGALILAPLRFRYRIVLFSNQHGPGKQRTLEGMRDTVRETLCRFDEFANFCNVPMQIFLATARGDINDPYRKPNTAMWDLMVSISKENECIVPDASQSFYVGNSAGRQTDGNDVDREFARRLGLEFRTEAWLRPQR